MRCASNSSPISELNDSTSCKVTNSGYNTLWTFNNYNHFEEDRVGCTQHKKKEDPVPIKIIYRSHSWCLGSIYMVSALLPTILYPHTNLELKDYKFHTKAPLHKHT